MELQTINQTGLVVNREALASLAKHLGKFDPNHYLILKTKYEGVRICNMSSSEILTDCGILLKTIHVITGWNLPNDLEYIKILTNELKEYLVTNFDDFNFNELALAIRTEGVGTIDWGKNMNIALIADSINNYLLKRKEASIIEMRLNEQPIKQVVLSAEELDMLMRNEAMEFWQIIKSGTISYLPTNVESILVKDFNLDHKDVEGFISKRVNSNLPFYEIKM